MAKVRTDEANTVTATATISVDCAELDSALEKVKEINELLERSVVLRNELFGPCKKATAGTVTLKPRIVPTDSDGNRYQGSSSEPRRD